MASPPGMNQIRGIYRSHGQSCRSTGAQDIEAQHVIGIGIEKRSKYKPIKTISSIRFIAQNRVPSIISGVAKQAETVPKRLSLFFTIAGPHPRRSYQNSRQNRYRIMMCTENMSSEEKIAYILILSQKLFYQSHNSQSRRHTICWSESHRSESEVFCATALRPQKAMNDNQGQTMRVCNRWVNKIPEQKTKTKNLLNSYLLPSNEQLLKLTNCFGFE